MVNEVCCRAGIEDLFGLVILIIIGIVGQIIKKASGSGRDGKTEPPVTIVSPQDQLNQFLQSIAQQPAAPPAPVKPQPERAQQHRQAPPPVPQRRGMPTAGQMVAKAVPVRPAIARSVVRVLPPPLDAAAKAATHPKPRETQVGKEGVVSRKPISGIVRAIRADIRDSRGLRRAVVLREILGPPVGIKKASQGYV